jgi:PTH1 family peptidyl-tRNA hydrolase
MNRSGLPAGGIMKYFGISGKDMVVIHDDIDLALGRIKIKEKGGHGGHNGIKSLTDTLGGGEFSRLRIGTGRPEAGRDVADYVLGRFGPDETKVLPEIIQTARDAVVTILCKGTKEGMNRFNSKSINV